METPQDWASLPVQTRLSLKFQMEKGKDDAKRSPVAVSNVVVPGHEVQADTLPKQPREVRAILESQGRKVVTRHSATILPGVPFKSGPRKGELRPDKLTDHYSLATVDKRYPVVLAYWDNADNMWYCKVAHSWTDRVEVPLITELKHLLEEPLDCTDEEVEGRTSGEGVHVVVRPVPGRSHESVPRRLA